MCARVYFFSDREGWEHWGSTSQRAISCQGAKKEFLSLQVAKALQRFFGHFVGEADDLRLGDRSLKILNPVLVGMRVQKRTDCHSVVLTADELWSIEQALKRAFALA